MATGHKADLRLSWQEVASALFAAKGINGGLWKVGVGLKFAAVSAGPKEDDILPAGVVAVEALVLTKTDKPGPLVFDAATTGSRGSSPRSRASGVNSVKSGKKRA